MTRDVEHFFIHLFSVCISLPKKCVLMSGAHVFSGSLHLGGLRVFLFVCFLSSSYDLDSNLLSLSEDHVFSHCDWSFHYVVIFSAVQKLSNKMGFLWLCFFFF